jgi:hypothetical protein
LSPSRAASSAHSSSCFSGCWRRGSAIHRSVASFPGLPLGRGGRLGVARPRHLGREAQAAQPSPAGRLADRDAEAIAGVAPDLRAGPDPAIGRRLLQGRPEVDLLIGRQLATAAAGAGAAVGRAGGPLGVPALEQGAGPDGPHAELSGGLGRSRGRLGSGQQPDQVPVGLRDAGAAGSIAPVDLLGGQVRDDRQPGAGHGEASGSMRDPPMISHPGNSVSDQGSTGKSRRCSITNDWSRASIEGLSSHPVPFVEKM